MSRTEFLLARFEMPLRFCNQEDDWILNGWRWWNDGRWDWLSSGSRDRLRRWLLRCVPNARSAPGEEREKGKQGESHRKSPRHLWPRHPTIRSRAGQQ